MNLFEYVVCSTLIVIAFVKLYEFVEFRIAMRENKEADDDG
jgi:hypothetical protein